MYGQARAAPLRRQAAHRCRATSSDRLRAGPQTRL